MPEVVQRRSDLRVIGAKGLLPDGQRAIEQRPGLGVVAVLQEQPAQVVEACGDIRVRGTEVLLADGQRLAGFRDPLSIAPLVEEPNDLGIQLASPLERVRILGRRRKGNGKCENKPGERTSLGPTHHPPRISVMPMSYPQCPEVARAVSILFDSPLTRQQDLSISTVAEGLRVTSPSPVAGPLPARPS